MTSPLSLSDLCQSLNQAIDDNNVELVQGMLADVYGGTAGATASPLLYVLAFRRHKDFDAVAVCVHLIEHRVSLPRMLKGGEWWKAVIISDNDVVMMLFLVASGALKIEEAVAHAARHKCEWLFTILCDPFHADVNTLRQLSFHWMKLKEGDNVVHYLMKCRFQSVDGGTHLPFQTTLTDLLRRAFPASTIATDSDDIIYLCIVRDASMLPVVTHTTDIPETRRVQIMCKNDVCHRLVGSALVALDVLMHSDKSPLTDWLTCGTQQQRMLISINENYEEPSVLSALSTRDIDLLSAIMCCGVGKTVHLPDGRDVCLKRTTPIPWNVWLMLFSHRLFVRPMRVRLCKDLVVAGVRVPALPAHVQHQWWRRLKPGQMCPTSVMRYLVACKALTPEDAVRCAVANRNAPAFCVLTDRVHAHPDALWPLLHMPLATNSMDAIAGSLRAMHVAAAERGLLADTVSHQPVLDRLVAEAFEEAVACGDTSLRCLFHAMVMRRDNWAHHVSGSKQAPVVRDEAAAVTHMFLSAHQQHQVGSALLSVHKSRDPMCRALTMQYMATLTMTRGRGFNAIDMRTVLTAGC